MKNVFIAIIFILVISNVYPEIITEGELKLYIPQEGTGISIVLVNRDNLDPPNLEWKSNTFQISPYNYQPDNTNTDNTLIFDNETVNLQKVYYVRNYVIFNGSDIASGTNISILAGGTINIENSDFLSGSSTLITSSDSITIKPGTHIYEGCSFHALNTIYREDSIAVVIDLDDVDELPEGINKNNIKLFYYDYNNKIWQSISCKYYESGNQIIGYIPKTAY